MINHKKLINGWGRVKPVYANIFYPKTVKDIKNILRKSQEKSILVRGLGRSYGDSAQLKNGKVLDLKNINKIFLNRDKGELTVGAGASFDQILKYIIPKGFFLPVVPGTKFITVGGAIASDVHGKNHHQDGSFGNFIKQIVILDSSSNILKISPTDSKNSTNSEMFWATVGGLGLTGIIIEAKISLLKISTAFMKVDTMRFKDIDSLMDRMLNVDKKYNYSVAWIDSLHPNGRGILTCANHASANDLKSNKKSNNLFYTSNNSFSIPSFFNLNLINFLSIKLFNHLWFLKSPKIRKNEIQTISKYFHPLDGIKNWNRLYGKEGFYQYQFVIPEDYSGIIKIILKELNNNNIPSFLVVLKRLGKSNKSFLSFPSKGWTMSLDFPASNSKILKILNKFDSYIEKAGGRIYLAKDSRQSSKIFKKTYSKFKKWNLIKRKMDKNNLFSSDISKRLKFD